MSVRPVERLRRARQGGHHVTVIGYAPGAYDLFHIGHLNILKHAAEHCDHLIAGVVSDEMLERNKGITPVVPLAERMEIVRHISFVDEVVAEVVPNKVDTWRSVGFDVIFKGDDWRGTPKGDKLERDFAAVGAVAPCAASIWSRRRLRSRISFCAASALVQRSGSSDRAFSSARRASEAMNGTGSDMCSTMAPAMTTSNDLSHTGRALSGA